MSRFYYISVMGKVTPTNTIEEFVAWLQKAEQARAVDGRPLPFDLGGRIVEQTEFGAGLVSTVFLGQDHSFGGSEPVLFETMIFGVPELENYQRRYTTVEQARAGHDDAITLVMARKETHAGDQPEAPADQDLPEPGR